MFFEGKITDIDGILVGHYTDSRALTGCTVIHSRDMTVCGVDVRGCAPGTRETDLLRGYNAVNGVNAIVLTGGSAFGLAAADGVMRYLSERDIGIDVGIAKVPIVPACVIFDLGVGDSSVRPDSAAGYAACENMTDDCAQGSVGCGTGATVGKYYDMAHPVRSGVGTACITLENGVKVAAMVAVNAAGNVFDYRNGQLLAGNAPVKERGRAFAGTNTTIGVIATNAALDREEANKLASIGHDGYAMAIRPVHTPNDGDTLFALATGKVEVSRDPFELTALFYAGAEVTARAIANAVTSCLEA